MVGLLTDYDWLMINTEIRLVVTEGSCSVKNMELQYAPNSAYVVSGDEFV